MQNVTTLLGSKNISGIDALPRIGEHKTGSFVKRKKKKRTKTDDVRMRYVHVQFPTVGRPDKWAGSTDTSGIATLTNSNESVENSFYEDDIFGVSKRVTFSTNVVIR